MRADKSDGGVVILGALGYFLLIAAIVLMVAFPAWRYRLASTFWLTLNNGVKPVARFTRSLSRNAKSINAGAAYAIRRFSELVVSHSALSGAAILVLVLPSVLAWALGSPVVFDFSENGSGEDRQIAVLLEGEQLVPPPSLPPEAFATREVEMVRPDVIHASRNWDLLDTEFTQRLLVVFKLMKERHGYDMVLIEGYRSPQRQEALLAQGSHVTRAGANMSYHQYGLAADSAFLKNGQVIISERDPWAMRGYELYGETAELVGLTWGGRWQMRDYGHVEMRRKGVLGYSGG